MTEIEPPEGYPFPDDEIIYCSAYDGFDPDANSYIAVARLPEEHVLTVGGKKHDNTHRLTIHTPIRGPTAFLVNPQADGFDFLAVAMNILAEDPANGGWGVAGGYIPFVTRKAGVEWGFNWGDNDE